MYGIGLILGAGIYVIIGDVAGIAGNAMWISFIIAAFIALFTGFSYTDEELKNFIEELSAYYRYAIYHECTLLFPTMILINQIYNKQ